MINAIWSELSAYSIPEIVAVLASLMYVVLAARNNRYCWPAALLGSSIFVVVLWQYQLLMDSALNVYYAAMAIYGWFMWSRLTTKNSAPAKSATGTPASDKRDQTLRLQTWPLALHVKLLLLVAILSTLSGYWLSQYSNADFPYLDSFTTWASLLATFMIARRVLENWLYWMVIDVISIYLYVSKDLFFTTALFVAYVVLAAYGYFYWRQQYCAQEPLAAHAK
jgi:nicotinamide mononucleotide transporter